VEVGGWRVMVGHHDGGPVIDDGIMDVLENPSRQGLMMLETEARQGFPKPESSGEDTG